MRDLEIVCMYCRVVFSGFPTIAGGGSVLSKRGFGFTFYLSFFLSVLRTQKKNHLFWKAKDGMPCKGFVTKVASFGLHVSFYGNVFGLLPAKALTRHGIEDPSEAFTTGQVCFC